MDRKRFVLAALSVADRQAFAPVQIQKLFFLIDRNIPEKVGGKYFNFQPYHYGPFDREVYDVLEVLELEGYVDIDESKGIKSYRLSQLGQDTGKEVLNNLPEAPRKYIKDVSDFVLSLSFTDLVAAIYKEYPDMKRRSVFVSY